MDLTNVLWTNVLWTTPMHSVGLGGCKGVSGGRGICSAVLVVAPFVGTAVATFERYLISHLSTEGTPGLADANAAINLGSDPNNELASSPTWYCKAFKQ